MSEEAVSDQPEGKSVANSVAVLNVDSPSFDQPTTLPLFKALSHAHR